MKNELSVWDNFVVQKSRPLQELARGDFSLCELKILDIYLARINSHNPYADTVVLSKGEIEDILGITRIRKADLESRLENLFTSVKIRDWKDGFVKVALFQKIAAKKVDGQWEITLVCTPEAKAYIFNVENIGYLKYKLKNIINLMSKYSYNLFLFLIDHPLRRKGTFIVPLDELKEGIGCSLNRNNDYRYFNRDVLKKACDEVNEKTALKFVYSPIRTGRNVSAIKFELTQPFEIPEMKFDTTDNQFIDVVPTNNQLDSFAEDNNYLFDHVDEIFSDEDFLSGN